MLDGTVRIPSRQEVIDRTKVVVINNVNTGSADTIYSSPDTLFDGLYRMDGDGSPLDQQDTSSKRPAAIRPCRPSISSTTRLRSSFAVKVNRSAYATRWPTIAAKMTEFDSLFPEESTGDLYAGRHENGWVIYNPYKTGQTASGSIPFKYNTCDRMELTFSQLHRGRRQGVRRTGWRFYLSNYDNVVDNRPQDRHHRDPRSTRRADVVVREPGHHRPA